MNLSKLLKTKTFKSSNTNFNRIKVQNYLTEIRFEFSLDKMYMFGIIISLAVSFNNEKFIRTILLKNYHVPESEIDDIINHLLKFYKLDLTDVELL